MNVIIIIDNIAKNNDVIIKEQLYILYLVNKININVKHVSGCQSKLMRYIFAT